LRGLRNGRSARDGASAERKFAKALHRRMLATCGDGPALRTSQRNMGIDYWLIPTELRKLLDDTKAWIEFKTYPADEIAVRFHHRLV